MSANRGKEFEDLFRDLAEKEGVDVVRFYDTLYKGKKGVKNPSDFVISKGLDLPSLLVECKACEGSSFSFSKFTQFDDLIKLEKFKSFLVVWFVEKKRVIAFGVQDVSKMKEKGLKSINPDKLGKINYVKPIELCNIFYRIHPAVLEVKKLWEK